jgi:hypothetical protein
VHLLNVNNHAMDIFNAAKKFRTLFNKEWQEDGYRDYLNPLKDEVETEEMILDGELKKMIGNAPVRLRKEELSITTTGSTKKKVSYAPTPIMTTTTTTTTESTSYDAASMETIREYLDTRPELKGILEASSKSPQKGGDISFLNGEDSGDGDNNGNIGPHCEISLGQYEKAMAALKSEVPLGAFDM